MKKVFCLTIAAVCALGFANANASTFSEVKSNYSNVAFLFKQGLAHQN